MLRRLKKRFSKRVSKLSEIAEPQPIKALKDIATTKLRGDFYQCFGPVAEVVFVEGYAGG